MSGEKTIEQVYNLISNASYKLIHIWITQTILTFRWWFGMVLTLLPWIVWIRIRDKRASVKLLFVGLIAMLVTITMDNIGISYHLWHYHWNVTPFALMFFPWDFSLFPVGIMCILQFKPRLNAYIKALGFSFFTAFVYEPFFVWMGMYHMVHWNYLYSFLIYFPLYLFFNYIYTSKFLN